MNEELSMIINESIQLELNVAELYTIFHGAFPEDADFWWKLLLEEKNHAALIRSIKEIFLPAGKFPEEMFSTSLEKLRKSNTGLLGLINKFRHVAPSREDAFSIALEVEQSAVEIHFQKFIDKKGKSNIEKIFEHLNRDDRDHVERLRSYMDAHQIDCRKENLQKTS